MEIIHFEDFKKLDIRIGKILSAEKVGGSDKLLKLQIDIGTEQRQIIAGIGKSYEPEMLVGKQIVVVANLEPRSLMGHESNGMLLAASDENGPVLLVPDKEVPAGTGIK